MVNESRLASIAAAIDAGEVRVTAHALTQMTMRTIRIGDALAALRASEAEIVETYLNDQRGPKCPVLSSVGGRALHLVVSFPPHPEVITSYWPDEQPDEWDARLRRRQKR